MGPTGGADWQVRVAPWRSRVLHWLPPSHAGAYSREESHSCRVLAPRLARPLVETSGHRPSLPSHLLPETATDHFPVWAYQMNIYFSFWFVVLDFLCCCFWAIASVYVCFAFVGSSLGVMSGIQWIFISLCSCWLQLLCSVHPPKKTVHCTASDSSLFVTLLH